MVGLKGGYASQMRRAGHSRMGQVKQQRVATTVPNIYVD